MRWITATALAMLFVVGTGPAGAQGPIASAPGATDAEGTRYFDYFVSRLRPAGEVGTELGSVGGRLMWSLAPVVGEGWGALLRRTAAGAFLAHAPPRAGEVEVWRYGAQADLPVLERPLAGRIDPILSVSVGAVRVRTPGGLGISQEAGAPPLLARPVLTPPRTDHDLSLAPGVGARVRLLPGLDLRGDARQVMDFGDAGIRRQLELSAGLSVRRAAPLR